MGLSSGSSNTDGQVNPSGNPPGRWGAVLGVIAIALVLILGYFAIKSLNRTDRELSGLESEMQDLRRQVAAAANQTQASAQQASQAAASAQAAATERDQAKQAQAKSAAEAQSARQQAAAAQLQASQAEQKAEEYRRQREAELARLQQVLGQIAETRRTALGLVMTLGDKSIRFDFDKSDVKPQYREILYRIAGVLSTLKGYSIYVYGYTDDIGTQAYNLGLSERRAQAVRDVLVQAGVDPKIITTKGFGKSDPRVLGDSQQARAANRRVEIGLVDSTLTLANQPLPDK